MGAALGDAGRWGGSSSTQYGPIQPISSPSKVDPSAHAPLTPPNPNPPAGELAIKCSSEELRPIALQALERLARILQARAAGCALVERSLNTQLRGPHGHPSLASGCGVLLACHCATVRAQQPLPACPPTPSSLHPPPRPQVPTGALPRSLVENAAITLGRIAWVCPEPLAPHAPEFLGPWCARPACQ